MGTFWTRDSVGENDNIHLFNHTVEITHALLYTQSINSIILSGVHKAVG